MNLSAREKLHRFYNQFSSDDQVLIIMNADPDAIASAMAAKRLLWRKVAGVTIANINVIDRPDNLSMVRLLGIKLTHVDDVEPIRYSRIVMVDSQPDHHEKFSPFAPHVIIDHHPDSGVCAPFVDIRPKYGAVASIMTEYLKAAKIKPSAKLATGLGHAIKTDTSDFQRQTLIEDLRAFQFLFKHANIALARRIEQADLRMDYLPFIRRGINNKLVRKEKLFTHLGQVPNPDICVLIADFLMRIDTINWTIVSGLSDRKLIIIFRNDGLRQNAGKVAHKGFGNLGSAGGHKSAARAEVPLGNLKSIVDAKDIKKLIHWIIKRTDKKKGHRKLLKKTD